MKKGSSNRFYIADLAIYIGNSEVKKEETTRTINDSFVYLRTGYCNNHLDKTSTFFPFFSAIMNLNFCPQKLEI